MELNAQTKLLYGLDDRPQPIRTVLYTLQWLGFTLANTMVVPVVVGPYLGLDAVGTAELVQRVFFFTGLASLLQVLIGHRLPILEGVAGMWWAIFISLGSTAVAVGKPLATLRTDLELALIAAGVVTLLLGATGIIARVQQLFTPTVTGTAMLLLAIELSSNVIPTMLGVGFRGEGIHVPAALLSLFVLACVAVVSLYAPRYLRSFGILIGLAVGWTTFALFGLTGGEVSEAGPPLARTVGFAWPLAWGPPTFDLGVIVICIMTGLILTANQITAIKIMEESTGTTPAASTLNRSLTMTGIANMLSGIGAGLGLSPFASSTGMVNLSGVAARMPFLLHALLLMLLGLAPSLAIALTHIPKPVGNTLLLAAACQLFLIGLRHYATMPLSQRDAFVLGAAVLGGTGVMFLPTEALTALHLRSNTSLETE